MMNRTASLVLIATAATMFACAAPSAPEAESTSAVTQGIDAFRTSDFRVTRIPLTYTPNFGSLSGLTYDPTNDTFWTHDDNRTGNVTYPTLFNFRVVGNNSVERLSSMPLRDENGANVVASPSNTIPMVSPGLDPEGIVRAPDGTFWMVEEENQTIMHVSAAGQIMQRLYAPGFSNATRVRGAGFEGVALSPDGNTVYAGQQTPLLGAAATDVNTYIVAYNIPTKTWRTYKVALDAVSSYSYPAGVTGVRMGMHELLFAGYDARGREQLVYIERDNQRDSKARDKRLYRVTLPDYATYGGGSVAKSLEIDMVALGYTREKPEGLYIIGNRYYVVNDNVQTATDPMELAIFQRLVPPTVACVGGANAPVQVSTDHGTCSATVSSASGSAGACSGGGDGLASCTFNGSDPASLALGASTVVVRGTANDGSSATCNSYLSVLDREAPSISVEASPAALWPPNHKMHEITLDTVASDNCGGPAVSCTATSNEEGEADDIAWKNGKLYLRAERNGYGSGRVYTVSCTATDGSGNQAVSTTTVSVAHNQ
jgi:hypothetical protein